MFLGDAMDVALFKFKKVCSLEGDPVCALRNATHILVNDVVPLRLVWMLSPLLFFFFFWFLSPLGCLDHLKYGLNICLSSFH